MTRPQQQQQQPSILSFFQPRSQPKYAAPPSAAAAPPNDTAAKGASTVTTTSPTPPPPPPLLPKQQQQPDPSLAGYRPQLSPSVPTPAPILLPESIPVLPSPPSLPNQASVVPLQEHHIPALRRINSLLLPVSYPDSFYAKALDPLASGLFSRVILWKDGDDSSEEAKVVGGVVCRLEPNLFVDQAGRPRPLPPPQAKSNNSSNQQPAAIESNNTPQFYAVYIQSLVLLSPYRSQGLAAAALDHIVASAAILPPAGSSIDVRTLYAHVWTENEAALRWYESRGFVREGRQPLQGYYFKLRPDTAWIMRRDIGPGAAAAPPPPATTTAAVPTMNRNNNNVLSAAVNMYPISHQQASRTPGPPPGGPTRQLSKTSASSAASSSLSFQNTRPETEWNDLPDDMVVQQKPSPASASASDLLSAQSGGSTPAGSRGPSSSRSSSTARKKDKKRTYPAAAFGQ